MWSITRPSSPGTELATALDCEKGGHAQDGEVDEDELDGGSDVNDQLISNFLSFDASEVVVEACGQVDEGEVREEECIHYVVPSILVGLSYSMDH